MPTGRLRAGYAKVAGVATVQARDELLRLMKERGLQSLSQALGEALQEWVLTRCHGVQNPENGQEDDPSHPSREEAAKAWDLARRLTTKELTRAVSSGRLYGALVAPWFEAILREKLRARKRGKEGVLG